MHFSSSQALLFTGSSHPTLAADIANYLNIPLGKGSLSRFPDGEIAVQLLEDVKDRDVFVLQSIGLDPNFYLMELLILVDALRRACVRSVVAVIPYLGYSRQDRRDKPQVPITAKLVANLLTEAGVNHVLTVDLHASQLQGFFDVPVDHVHGYLPLLKRFQDKQTNECVVVAPDIGSVGIARTYASELKSGFAVINKQRFDDWDFSGLTLIGDVKGKDVLLADDICSTGATLASAAKACHEKGAKRVFGVVTHGLCVEGAVHLLDASPLETLWMTNTIPYTDRLAGARKLETVSIAPLLGHAISCITSGKSLLFK